MTTIKTTPDGTRWRDTDHHLNHCFEAFEGMENECVCDGAEPLPRIPNWPLPSLAPQFISNERTTTARDGDIVVLVANDCSFIDPCAAGGAITIRCRTEASDWSGAIDGYGVGPIGEIADYMDANGWDGARAYLIQRRDPTEDIEHGD